MALKVLSALDSARTQYYHFKAIVIAGMGLFTDAYDLFCIPPVMKLIGRIYYADQDGKTPPAVVTASVAVALLGMVAGQLAFGYLGDRMGRRRVYGMSLLLMVSGSIGCGFSICRTRACVLTSLCFFRFLLGVGIGGDYPLSATIMSEFANKRTRGAFIAAVFSMQGFGILVSSAVTMAVAKGFEHASRESRLIRPEESVEADLAWRVILMFGAVPAGLTFYWRMMMPETARYTALVENNVRKATADMQTVLDGVDLQPDADDPIVPQRLTTYGLFSRQFFREHGKDLFACSASWFLVDVVFYSSNLFQSHIYQSWFRSSTTRPNLFREAYNVAKFQAIIAVASTIPGYFAAVYLIDRVGRRKLQAAGFLLMAVFLFAIGGPYDKFWGDRTTAWFIVLYALTFFFANFGPNTTTFIVPAEMFPARFRSTCHGVSGAAGKLGAIFGAVGFLWASQSKDKEKRDRGYRAGIGMMHTLLILGGVCVVGVICTLLFTRETKGLSLEENESPEEEEEDDDDVGRGGRAMPEMERNGTLYIYRGNGSGMSERALSDLRLAGRSP